MHMQHMHTQSIYGPKSRSRLQSSISTYSMAVWMVSLRPYAADGFPIDGHGGAIMCLVGCHK